MADKPRGRPPLVDIVMQAMFEAEDDAMLGRSCRCGCGQAPSTDHYLSRVALAELAAIGADLDDEP